MQYERWVISELLEIQPYAPHIYIGADDIQEEGTYIWVATRQPLSYTKWAPSEPTGQGQRGDGEEDCLALESSYGGWGWNDMCCTCSYRPVVCEFWLFVDCFKPHKMFIREFKLTSAFSVVNCISIGSKLKLP